jgi:hypothetical protein
MRKWAKDSISAIIANGPRVANDGTLHSVEELILLSILGEFCPDLVRITGG